MKTCQFSWIRKLSLYGIKFTVKATWGKGLTDSLSNFMLRCWRRKKLRARAYGGQAMTESKRKKRSFVVRNMKVDVSST